MYKKRALKSIFFIIIAFYLAKTAFAVEPSSQTFFMPRSTALDPIQKYALHYYRTYHADYEGKKYTSPSKKTAFNLQATVLGQESTNKNDLAYYFLIDGKTELLVDQQGNGDIGSEWIELSAGGSTTANFRGTFSVEPKRSLFGVNLYAYHDLSSCIDGLWISASLPFVHVKHNLNFTERNVSSNIDPTSRRTISDALNQENFMYGKWSPNGLSKSGLADSLVTFGYDFLQSEYVQAHCSLEILIPFGEKPTAEHVFEPVIGTGGHFGLGAGIGGEAQCIKNDMYGVSLLAHLRYHYLFSGTEKRSFDLKNRPWSRYLIYKEEKTSFENYAIPGINIFTQDFTVKPGSSVDLSAILHCRYHCFNIETGYAFWWKSSESVDLKNPWTYSVSIPAQGQDDQFLPEAEINDPWPTAGTTSFKPLKQEDLDLESAAHKKAFSHTFYGAISLNGQLGSYPAMLGCGGSYEIGDRNTALNLWSLWLALSIGF